ncbi:MAG: response regulator [Candidatus Hinthialibacter antarcticus]|nr:response regulator [Candidatus Hinthialibacter antarcticus]
MRKLIVLIMASLISIPAVSQEWMTRLFIPPIGKTFEEVRDIKRSDDDSIWFASWGNGIACLKENTWHVFTTREGLPSNFVPSIEVDQDEVWAVTDEGIVHISQDGVIQTINQNALSIIDEESFNEVKRMNNGEIWFGSDSGSIIACTGLSGTPSINLGGVPIIFMNRKWFIVKPPANSSGTAIYEIFEDKDQKIWVAADRNGLYFLEDNEWKRAEIDFLEYDRVRQIAQDSDGALAITGGAFLSYDGENWEEHKSVNPYTLETLPNGQLILVDHSHVYYQEQNEWIEVPFPIDAGNPTPRVLYFANNNHGWIGTKEGVIEVIRKRFKLSTQIEEVTTGSDFIAKPNYPPLAINSTHEILQFSDPSWKSFLQLPLSESSISPFLSSVVNDRFWAFTGSAFYEISIYDKKIVKQIPKPEDFSIIGLLHAADNRLYAYSNTEIYLNENDQWIPFVANNNPNSQDIVFLSQQHDGALLVCRTNCVEIWKSNQLASTIKIDEATDNHPLTFACQSTDARIWLGTRGLGVFIWDGAELIKTTTSDGLLSNRIVQFFEDSFGTVWLGTEHLGLSSYKDGHWINYSHSQGIPSSQLNSIGEYPEGTIWVSTLKDQIYSYTRDRQPPYTVIEKSPESIPYNSFGIFSLDGYDKWNHTEKEKIVFSWRIIPYLNKNGAIEWSPFSPEKSVSTPLALPPGKYRFEVKAADMDRNIDLTPSSHDFVILPPPITSRVWFILLITALLLLTFFMFISAFFSKRKLAVYANNLEKEVDKRTAEITSSNQQLKNEISERTELQETLEKNERTYRMAIKAADAVPYYRKHNSEHYDYIGEGLFRITGCHPDEFTNSIWKSLEIDRNNYHLIQKRDSNDQENHSQADIKIQSKTGELRWVSETSLQLNNDQGQPLGVLGLFQDITERKRMEEELLKSRKLESIGLLAGGIAHDFNNMLTAILGNISLARVLCEGDDNLYKYLTKAEKASLRAQTLTQQLLTFSKGGAPVKEVISIPDLVRETASFTLRGSNVICVYDINEDVWTLNIDKGQICQVIQNLLINADQAMPDGGTLEIGVHNAFIEEGQYQELPSGNYVKILVRDYGAGIPEENLTKIFDPYFSTKPKGNGLGLATAYSIIKNHNGLIFVESIVNKGTVFTILLPGNKTSVPSIQEPSEVHSNSSGITVLLMDDEEMVRDITGTMLEHLGYKVNYAKDGKEAIDQYQITYKSDNRIDCVIMDLTIPGAMGGKEAIQHLKDIDPNVKAIVSSGYSNDPVMANYADYGFSGVLNKPYQIEKLDEALKKIINKINE